MEITAIGLDLAKSIFQVHGVALRPCSAHSYGAAPFTTYDCGAAGRRGRCISQWARPFVPARFWVGRILCDPGLHVRLGIDRFGHYIRCFKRSERFDAARRHRRLGCHGFAAIA